MRIVDAAVAVLGGLAFAFAVLPPTGTDAGTQTPRDSRAWAAGPNQHAAVSRARRRLAAAPGLCPTPNPKSFTAIGGVGNVPGGNQSSVLGGNGNDACGPGAAVVAGQDNGVDVTAEYALIGGGFENRIGDVSADRDASFSFVGAGVFNDVTGLSSFIGAGGDTFGSQHPNATTFANQVSGNDSFVGGGDLASVSGQGSFVGAGGYAYAASGATGTGDSVAGNDSFVGAGNLNSVAGESSFIGAGGYAYEETGATTAGNQISGNDSFIGAGNQGSIVASESFIGAGNANVVAKGGSDSAIGGGSNNTVTNQYDALGGGQSNGITAALGWIGGGSANAILMNDGATTEANGATYGAIGGGFLNLIEATAANGAQYAFVGGGANNEVTAQYGTVAGGDGNVVTGYMAAVPGGYRNLAAGRFSFAAGYASRASTDGSFVWSDDSPSSGHVTPVRANQFIARAVGGVTFLTNAAQTTGVVLAPGSGAWASASDRNLKRDVAPLDPATVLAKVAALPVAEWSYASERGVRHVGPMAQDFYAAFKIGEDDRHITSIDEDGVALAAIKGLDAKLARKDAELAALRAELPALKAELHALEAAFAKRRRSRT